MLERLSGSDMNKLTVANMQVEALRKQIADAQATIADLQGQVAIAKEGLPASTKELIDAKEACRALQQRVAQLESLKLGKEVGACEHCLYCVWESCAQNALQSAMNTSSDRRSRTNLFVAAS